MKISNMMTKNLVTIEENSTILEAIKKMHDKGCGILPICKNKRATGVITDRDILIRTVAQNKNVEKIPIAEIMSKNVIFCEENDLLKKAVSLMNQHNIRRILIKNKNEEVIGILSLGDIIRRVEDKSLLANLFKETRVA